MKRAKKISLKEANEIMGLEEGPYLDLKSSDIAPAKLSRAISAFANTSGGELFVGIREGETKNSRTWSGFDQFEEANAFFQVLEEMQPSGGLYNFSFLECDDFNGYVLHLTIFKTKEIISATDKTPYIRRNAQSLPVSSKDGLKRLELDKGIATFEDNTFDADLSIISNSSSVLSFILNVVPSAEPEEWLQKQNLICKGLPTVAGIMLFSDEPQALLPKRSAIKIYRYKTTDEEGSRDNLAFHPITIEGCAYDLIHDAVAKTKEVVEDISLLTGKGLEKVRYPDAALHEIITNAVLHRDYSIASDIHVRVYDNRIEVESPGRLSGHVTIENILQEQSARNPKIVRLINKFPNPPNKDVGEGLNTAFQAMKKLRLQEPEIEERDNSFIVHIRHVPLASPHDIIMDYLEENEEITNRMVRQLTGIGSENVVKKIFYDLKNRKMIEPVPDKGGSSSAWRKYTEEKKPPPKDLLDFIDT